MDESDVYVDVHKAVRRLQPAPRARRHLEANAVAAAAANKRTSDGTILVDINEDADGSTIKVGSLGAHSDNGIMEDRPRTAIFMKRRSSEGPESDGQTYPVKASLEEMKAQLRLGPANRAANPRSNKRDNLFKIKQGLSTLTPTASNGSSRMPPRSVTVAGAPTRTASGHERTPLLGDSDR